MMQVECSKKLHQGESIRIETYGDLGFMALGNKGRYLTEIMVFISQATCVIAYLIFIGQNLSSVFITSIQIRPTTFIFFVVLPLEFALSFIRSFTSLAPFSIFADACNALAVVIVLKDEMGVINGFSEKVAEANAFDGIWGIPFAAGIAVFCFDGFTMTLPLESSMADRKLHRRVLSLAFLGITIVYVFFGFLGYIAYGDDTQDIVTLNLPNDWSSITVKIGLCVGLAFTFPIVMHPIYDMAEMRLKSRVWFIKICEQLHGAEWAGVHILRMLLLVSMAMTASFIPGFGAFISFTGSTVCALLAFVFPAAFHLRFLGPSLNMWRKVLDWIILSMGLVFAIYGSLVAVFGNSMV